MIEIKTMRFIIYVAILLFCFSCKTNTNNKCEDLLEKWNSGTTSQRGNVALCLKQDFSLLQGKSKNELISLLGAEDGFGSNDNRKYISYEVDIGTRFVHELRIYFDPQSGLASDLLILD